MSVAVLHAMFALGAGLGAVLRHWLSRLIDHHLPVATLVVNVLGSFVLGAVLAMSVAGLDNGGAAASMALRAVIGFCGGFTTFSSFAVQSLALYRQHSLVHLLSNVALNLSGSLMALALGATLFSG